ncbi:hypothetical protein KDE12_01280 [Campylobacter sp. faydin G-105]|uniref:structural cement protein Gp24 n=1 Tax=Campylobacter anatolicus TaxID=2829105 RepID=UPI001B94678E|nr:hypothetical protein [Campylobacter anatolicus]MBR8461484.1 hypothetical protein [Campylobacter anatolicus]
MDINYLEKRVFAGQVARAGESGVIAMTYVNKDDKSIPFGVFVAQKEDGVGIVSKADDNIVGVSLKLGSKNENKPDEPLSVLAIPHGTEVWVKGSYEHGLDVGDEAIISVDGMFGGTVAKSPSLAVEASKGKFYVTGVVTGADGDLIKIMRKEA